MFPMGLVLSSALDGEEEERVGPAPFRYCHHCQKPIEGHQYQYAPNRFLCAKCYPYRYMMLANEDRDRPGPGDRISDREMEFG